MADGNIVAAKKQLDEAVARMCAPNWKEYQRRLCQAPSLYQQLQSDLAGTQGDTRTPAKSLPPLWIDAVELLKDIDGKARTWTGRIPFRNAETTDRLLWLIQKSFRPQDTKRVTQMASTVDGWCEAISHMLNPESVKHISAPCPSCGREWVYRRDSAGETVRQPALKVVTNIGAMCQHCDVSWAPDRYLFLCRLLGFDLPEGVLE